jgi:hypothetical protein
MKWGIKMVNVGKGRVYRRKDGRYLIYLPKSVAEDSMFPFGKVTSAFEKVTFAGDNKLTLEKLKE